jgi:glyoxylase-like metal-dependent hydrolase (beta-lactamase superfamily II)
MNVIPLSEGSFTIDATKQFIPFEVGKDLLTERSKGSLLVEIQPFVVITIDDVILLDAGLGFNGRDTLQLHENLQLAGINPASVTKVLLSHLHKDHAGGIFFNEGLQYELSFPHAQYYLQKKELEHALHAESRSYHLPSLKNLVGHPQVILLEGDGVIDGYIQYRITGAHSPFHQVFWIVDGGMKIFYGGDEAPQLQQMKSRFVAKYDYDGKRSMELRQEWWKQGAQEGWTFLFYHDIKSPLYSFE